MWPGNVLDRFCEIHLVAYHLFEKSQNEPIYHMLHCGILLE